MRHNISKINFAGARKGATGTLEDLKTNPPVPKDRLLQSLVDDVLVRLQENQHIHSRLKLHAIIHGHFYDPIDGHFRIVWARNMITAAGVSRIEEAGAPGALFLLFRDGEEERKDNSRWMRRILEGLYEKGSRARESVEDFVYLTLVHEASEIHHRKQAETLSPSVKAEVRAEIEEAKAYFALPLERRRTVQQLYRMLDETSDPLAKVFSRELELFESIGEDNLGTIEGLLSLIDFVLEAPDYARESNLYPDHAARFQLSKSLFIDVLHDFASSNHAGKWVRAVESSETFADHHVKYVYTDNSRALSSQAAEILDNAARILEALKEEDSGPPLLPGKVQKRQAIEGFNNQIKKLDSIKGQLKLNEVLSITSKLKAVLEDNRINRHFSYMDNFGIYHSLNLSRLDLRKLDLHSGNDERSARDLAQGINFQKDKRADLKGAHIFGSDLSGRANFSGAQLDFLVAPFSDLSEINFSRTRAIGIVLYGANANEGQFERAKLTAADARGMSASFARIQMEETDINGMKIWQCDVPKWQRAYVGVSQRGAAKQEGKADKAKRDSMKAELDFLDDSFLDSLDAIVEDDNFQMEDKWIELREVDGQLEFLKGRGIVFYSRDEILDYSTS